MVGILSLQLAASLPGLPGDTTKVINGKTYVQHKVEAGQTLYGLSKQFGTSVDNLKSVNDGMANLQLGTFIWVPKKEVNSASASTNFTVQNHTVQAGETLYSISKTYEISVDDIKQWNNLSDNTLNLGQVLSLKNAVNSTTKTVVATPTETKPVVTNTPTPITTTTTQTATNAATKVINTVKVAETSVTAPSAVAVTVHTNDETTEKSNAAVVDAGNMDAERCFIKHPNVPVGSIVVVINPNTGKMAYCRVIENAKTAKLNNGNIEMTTAVAEKIGLTGKSGLVTLKYATL